MLLMTKKSFSLILTGLAVVAVGAICNAPMANASTGPVLVDVLPDQIFAPMGFDDNDNAQVVLSGVFPDSCYRVGPAEAKVDVKHKRIIVRAQAYHYPDAVCLQVRTPWIKSVDLGVLPSMDYALFSRVDKKNDYPRGNLPVAIAKVNTPDDYNYAFVTDAVVQGLQKGGTVELTLFGTVPMTCMSISEVQVHYRESNVIEVLPVVKINESVPCAYPFLPIPIQETVRLERKLEGSVLVHVRSAEGAAVNRVVLFP